MSNYEQARRASKKSHFDDLRPEPTEGKKPDFDAGFEAAWNALQSQLERMPCGHRQCDREMVQDFNGEVVPGKCGRCREVTALTAERDGLKRELEVAQAGCVEMQKACKNAAWLYDEMALGPLEAAAKYGDNYEPPSDKVCLAIREALHNVVTFPNPGAPLIAELTKLREQVKK